MDQFKEPVDTSSDEAIAIFNSYVREVLLYGARMQELIDLASQRAPESILFPLYAAGSHLMLYTRNNLKCPSC